MMKPKGSSRRLTIEMAKEKASEVMRPGGFTVADEDAVVQVPAWDEQNDALLRLEQETVELEIRRRLQYGSGSGLLSDSGSEELRKVRQTYYRLRTCGATRPRTVRLTCAAPELLQFPANQLPPLVVRVGVSPNAGEQFATLADWREEALALEETSPEALAALSDPSLLGASRGTRKYAGENFLRHLVMAAVVSS